MFIILTVSTSIPTQTIPEAGRVSPTVFGQLRQTLLRISRKEATFAKRGFLPTHPKTQKHLEAIGKTFLQGYEIAIALSHPPSVITQLNEIATEYRGFAFEGAAMGLGLLDYLTPWNRTRIGEFLASEGVNHIYMTYMGMGWLLARLSGSIQSYLTRIQESDLNLSPHPIIPSPPHPLIGWLTIDGYGFHQGYFHWQDYIQNLKPPTNLSGYSCRVFDQGLGRSLWFVKGANILAIEAAIAQFHPMRRADLWSGVGLACGYAGGVEKTALERLKAMAQPYYSQLAQGVAFAAKTSIRAGNLTEHTEIAAQVLCGMSAQQAAQITDDTLVGLFDTPEITAYEQWRQRIQNQFI